MCRNSADSASGLKTVFPLCSTTTIFYKLTKIVAIYNTESDFWHIFTAHAQKPLLRYFRSKI